MKITYVVEMENDERDLLFDAVDNITKLKDEMEQFKNTNDEYEFLEGVIKDLEEVLHRYSK